MFLKANEEPLLVLQRPSLVVQGLKTQQRISQGIIAIHTYRQCSQVANQPAPPKKYDNSIAKFKNELQESHLLKLWSKHRGLWLATPRLALHFLIDTTWPAKVDSLSSPNIPSLSAFPFRFAFYMTVLIPFCWF